MYKLSSLESAERFVERQQRAGNDVRWNNYDIVFFKKHPAAWCKANGVYRAGSWGFENTFPVQSDGTWLVDKRNVTRVV